MTVFPLPSSPRSATTLPGPRLAPSARPRERVPSAEDVHTLTRSTGRRLDELLGALLRQHDGAGQDHLLERDPPVLEAALVLPFVPMEVGRVHEVVVFLRDGVLLAGSVGRQPESGRRPRAGRA